MLDIMVGTTLQKRENIGSIYLAQAGHELVEYLADYFAREKKADVRRDLLRFAGPFAATDVRVIELAQLALSDRSADVRGMALFVFAQSGNTRHVSVLESWTPPDARDVDGLDRAIRALSHQDLQEWVRHTPYSSVIPFRFTRFNDDVAFRGAVDLYIKKFAADLVPKLIEVLGSLYLEQGPA
jgi:hypothetical protein